MCGWIFNLATCLFLPCSMNMPQAKKDFDFRPHLLTTYIKTYKCGIFEKMIYFKKFKT
jgi:hypothetical protein